MDLDFDERSGQKTEYPVNRVKTSTYNPFRSVFPALFIRRPG